MSKLIFISAIIISLFIRGFLIFNGKHVADIWHISEMGKVLLAGQNPYLVLNFNVYPPLSLAISAISLILSDVTKIPFHIIIKIWPNLADFATAIIIYKFLLQKKNKQLSASLWGSFFILNPIAIILSAAHGQLDSISSFLVILAIYLLKKYPMLSAFSLGLSIAVKPNPLILIFLFIFNCNLSVKKRLKYLLFVAIPIIVSLLPFLLQNPIQVIRGLLVYSGVADFGYAAILRGIWFQNNANANLPPNLITEFINSSKLVLIVGITLCTLLLSGWRNLSKSILVIYLLFISFYFGISAQYLSWIIPFAIMVREKFVIIYTILGTIALIGFYLYFGPDLLLGKLTGKMLPFENQYIYYYFYGNLLLWFSCLFWLGRITAYYLKTEFYKLTSLRKQLFVFGSMIFTIAFIPLLLAAQDFFRIYMELEK